MAPVFQAAAVGAEPTGTGYVLGMDTTSHDLGAVRLHALEAGVGGAPLLLVHGFTGCKEDFAEEVDGLFELHAEEKAFQQRKMARLFPNGHPWA